MPELTARTESFIEIMKKGDEFARYGFELLSRQPIPESYFEPLHRSGFFDPSNNPSPTPSTEPGFVRVPFWPALTYLQAVAKRAAMLNDRAMAAAVLEVVRSVSNFREPDGRPRDNYHTYRNFAEIIGVLPLNVVTDGDIDLADTWLESRFDTAGVARALGHGVLKKLLEQGDPDDVVRACRLMRLCLQLRQIDDERRSPKIVTRIEDHWLRELVDTFARDLGRKGRRTGVEVFESGLREIFADTGHGFSTTLWRPAVESSPQNWDFHGPQNRLCEGARDALAGWMETGESDAADYVLQCLTDKDEIVRRVAIHTVTEYFDRLREAFETSINISLFTSGHRHELYRLLSERFASLSPAGREKVLSALKELPEPKTGDEQSRRVRSVQLEWLSAIKDQPEARDWYKELSSDSSLGLAEHPDFMSYHEIRSGPGPTPFDREALIAFAQDGTIVDRLNSFTQADSWNGPSVGGLVAALEASVASSPNIFLPLLDDFHRAKVPFQHAMLAGFRQLHGKAGNGRQGFEWDTAWPKILKFFDHCLADVEVWTSSSDETIELNPTPAWLLSLMADYLEAGTRDDETAYPEELLPLGWNLIQILLARAPDEKFSVSDPMIRALNTQKGRAIEALYSHALRVCRVSRKKEEPADTAWAGLEPVFDSEIAKCRNGNFEFSTLSASHISNLDYMSHSWLAANIKRLFPEEYPENMKAALGGLAYATPYRMLYKLLASNHVFAAALDLNLEDSQSRERIVQWICLGYLWDDESLDTPLMARILEGVQVDLQNAVDLFCSVRGDQLTSMQLQKVLAFWRRCIGWAALQSEKPTRFLAHLGGLASYVSVLDAEAVGLLRLVLPYVHLNHGTDNMIDELARLAPTNPQTTGELLEMMFSISTPTYDLDDKLKNLLRALDELGEHDAVLQILERLRNSLPGTLELYKELRASPIRKPS